MSKKQNVIHYALFGSAVFLLSVYFTHMHIMLCVEAKRASLALLLGNLADTPFQYRALIPWFVHFISGFHFPRLGSPIPLFKITEFAFTFFLCIVFRTYIALFIKNEIRSSVYALSIFLILPYQYVFYSLSYGAIYYPSDIPSVFFFTSGLILIYKKNWLVYYPVFIIATFNRETTVFLIFIFWITTIEKSKMVSVTLHCLLQMAIWLFIKQYLAVLYADNPGPGFFINFISANWSMLLNPINALRMATNFCFIWIVVLFRFTLITDVFLKKTMIVVLPFLLGMLIVGNIIEMRIYGELIPVCLSAFLVIIDRLLFPSHCPILGLPEDGHTVTAMSPKKE